MTKLQELRSESLTAKVNMYMYLAGLVSDIEYCKRTGQLETANEITKELKQLLLDLADEKHLQNIGQ